MVSSNGFGRAVTVTGPRVQVRPALGAESGTVVPAEQQVGVRGQRQLLAHDLGDVYAAGTLGQGIEIGIVSRFRVGREDRRVYVDVHLVEHVGQTATALPPHHAVNATPPEVFPVSGGLQLPRYGHRPDQAEPQPLEDRIVGLELPVGPDGASLKVPDVHSQHSRLT